MDCTFGKAIGSGLSFFAGDFAVIHMQQIFFLLEASLLLIGGIEHCHADHKTEPAEMPAPRAILGTVKGEFKQSEAAQHATCEDRGIEERLTVQQKQRPDSSDR